MIRIHLFLLGLRSFLHPVYSIHLHNGQCPLKFPSSLSTKSPTQLSQKRRTDLMTIAHRGASYSLPEHTIPAYRLALELGTDYIETDLVGTRDGRLIAIHNVDLNITTNIDEVYPGRHRNIEINGEQVTGFFAFDFSMEELESVRVRQRVDGRSTTFDLSFGIPTLHDIIDLMHEWNTDIEMHQNLTRRSGLYAELKSPDIYTHAQNTSLADLFIEEMNKHPHAGEMFFNAENTTTFGCEKHNTYQVPPLVVECFDGNTLEKLRSGLIQHSMALPPFVLLVSKKDCHSSMFWFQVGRMNFLSGVGPDKACVLGSGGSEFMIESRKFDLAVHAWTIRSEIEFVSYPFNTAEEELRYLYCKVGVAGIFSENVDLSVKVATRGCDDFITPEELLEEDITEIEEEDGGRVDGSISKEICRQESGGNQIVRYVASILSGFALGVLGTLIISKKHAPTPISMAAKEPRPTPRIIHHGQMKGMQTLSTEDAEII